jgi:hypothetical protein
LVKLILEKIEINIINIIIKGEKLKMNICQQGCFCELPFLKSTFNNWNNDGKLWKWREAYSIGILGWQHVTVGKKVKWTFQAF